MAYSFLTGISVALDGSYALARYELGKVLVAKGDCAAAKIDKDDKFRLLLQTGQDPVGAVSVRPLEDEQHG